MPEAARRWTSRTVLVATLLVLAIAGAACGTRTIREEVYQRDSVTVTLRHRIERGTVVDRGFQQPASIAMQRLSHILGAIDIETSEGDKKGTKVRTAAFLPELLGPVARGLSAGLEEADADQEIAVTVVRKQRRLGLFHKKFLTSFVAYVKNERLYVHLSRVEWEIPKDREDDDPPAPQITGKQMAFRTVAARKMSPAGSQGVAVRWRDPLFSAPVRSARPVGGAQQRRTILFESAIPAEELDAADAPRIEGLDPDTLRALADLEEARRAGNLTETEYQQRRETLLGGDRF